MINITFLNGEGGGFGTSEEVDSGITIEQLFESKWPFGDPDHFQISVNGEEVPADYIINEGDRIMMIAKTEEAKQPGYGQVDDEEYDDEEDVMGGHNDRSGDPDDPAETFQVLFINNDGAGFAEKVDVPMGTSISDFLAAELPDVDLTERTITVNGAMVSGDYPLGLGDKIAVTPLKVDGAADRVLLVKNDGTGFANYVDLPENGVTIDDFLLEHVGPGYEDNNLIRVNSLAVARDYVLRPGDKISVTPQKVDGGC